MSASDELRAAVGAFRLCAGALNDPAPDMFKNLWAFEALPVLTMALPLVDFSPFSTLPLVTAPSTPDPDEPVYKTSQPPRSEWRDVTHTPGQSDPWRSGLADPGELAAPAPVFPLGRSRRTPTTALGTEPQPASVWPIHTSAELERASLSSQNAENSRSATALATSGLSTLGGTERSGTAYHLLQQSGDTHARTSAPQIMAATWYAGAAQLDAPKEADARSSPGQLAHAPDRTTPAAESMLVTMNLVAGLTAELLSGKVASAQDALASGTPGRSPLATAGGQSATDSAGREAMTELSYAETAPAAGPWFTSPAGAIAEPARRSPSADTLAALVNDVLAEQARRHGVDLS